LAAAATCPILNDRGFLGCGVLNDDAEWVSEYPNTERPTFPELLAANAHNGTVANAKAQNDKHQAWLHGNAILKTHVL